ncbi:SAM hydrolase/SAM-dependent halogenase family protein [Fundidesulfovibrio agrisoli]|uniref:SAM hydrolase/SAM-dependent halogenase family protein n=1 Tax=Fundidesulfovibrio agrisoli TaxID=2922717 RepID=UPI001FAC6F01|nr:SAM-dependent chlorinase/fluorinase [Fundidesulfovibrio agrisoli]
MHRHVALLTDFGLDDPYVGQMKGALAMHGPCVPVLDLCHHVTPYNTLQAGFLLRASCGHFPPGTVFVNVVDPGVGGSRRIVILEALDRFFLAPDNGLLTMVLEAAPDCRAFAADISHFAKASATFHGRDVFAPLAVRLALGADPDVLGTQVDPAGLVRLPELWAHRISEGAAARVLHVDRFGNCLLNMEIDPWKSAIESGEAVRLASGQSVTPCASYEALNPGCVGILAGSQGVMELAMNMSSAAEQLMLEPGSEVIFLFG